MVVLGEAVGLVADVLEELSSGGIGGEPDGLVHAVEEDIPLLWRSRPGSADGA